jgi:alpha-galactosidase
MDFNIEAGPGTERNADSLGDGLLEHNRAYLRWIDSLYERYPDLIIENCSSGGLRADYAMLAHHPILSITDQTDCRKMAHIAATAALTALPEQVAVWAYPKADNKEHLVMLNMVNALPLRIHLSGQVMDLDPIHEEWIRKAVALYKQIRHRIPQSVPFFPCGLPHYDDKIFCTAYKSDKTYLAVWRLDTDVEALEIPLCGTHAKILYGKGELEGDENSLTVILPQENSAVFIEL